MSLYGREQLIDMIKVSLGGRVAESIFFGKVTTGASDDIKKVTQIAQGFVNSYGMSHNIGVVSYASLNQGYVNSYSNKTSLALDTEVKRLVDECYSEIEELLISKKDAVEALALELLEKETINLP